MQSRLVERKCRDPPKSLRPLLMGNLSLETCLLQVTEEEGEPQVPLEVVKDASTCSIS